MVMPDQAAELRQLARHSFEMPRSDEPPRQTPRLVMVVGAKGGVGTTTMAINTALAVARLNRQCVLVDANFEAADVAALCGLDDHATSPDMTLAGVLSGKKTVSDVLREGPEGIQVAAGAWGDEAFEDCSRQCQQRLVDQLHRLDTDVAVLDAGSGLNRVRHRFWQAADAVLLVTSQEPMAVMDAYAAIKVLGVSNTHVPVHLLVNQVDPSVTTSDTFRRIAVACRRFLGREIEPAGKLPLVDAADHQQRLLALQAEGGPTATALRRFAQQILKIRK